MNEEGRAAGRGEGPEAANGNAPFEGREGALATDALVAGLQPSELPAGGWERLSAAVGARRAEPVRREAGRAGTAAADRRAAPRPGRSRPYVYASVATLALAALAVVGTWGYLRGAEAARLRDDQRILAYWMSNPEMRLTALEPAAGVPTARLGVLCVLPDGRALVLQPSPAERGSTYVVVGWGAGGLRELARGRENMLQFDVTDVEVVELRAERGDDVQTLALARLN